MNGLWMMDELYINERLMVDGGLIMDILWMND
jgi:hypothetical protein